ncbi:MAG TPA: hypothetical protein VIP51_13000 [Eoetvoesiella sp.]
MKRLCLIAYGILALSGISPGMAYASQSPLPHRYMAGGTASSSAAIQELAPVQVYAAPQLTIEPPRLLPDLNSPELGMGGGKSLSERFAEALTSDLSYMKEVRQLPAESSAASTWGARHRKPLVLSSLNSNAGWSLGSDSWRLRRSDGLDLTLGSAPSRAPEWGNSARLGGIALSRSLSGGAVAENEWQYSVALGALDYSTVQGTGGELVFGPTASDSVIRYGASPQLTLESQVQVASDLLMTGVGGEYSLNEWGAWTAGVARATRSLHEGWRYRVGYEVSLMDTLQLSWVNEQRSGGFSDLTRYQDFAADAGRRRNLWAATLPLGRWGDLRSSYEEISADTGAVKQYFGLTQQFWYSPNLRVALKADREFVSGDYGIAVRFSVPID